MSPANVVRLNFKMARRGRRPLQLRFVFIMLRNQCFFSMCPPNWKRIADRIFDAKSDSPRDVNRS